MIRLVIIFLVLLAAVWQPVIAQETTASLNPVHFLDAGAGIEKLSLSPDGSLLLVKRMDGQNFVWNLATYEVVQAPAAAIAFTHDSQIVYADADGIHLPEMVLPISGVEALALSMDDRLLAASTSEGTVEVYDLTSSTHLMTLVGYRGAAEQLAFLPNGRVLISSNAPESEIRFWDTQSSTNGQIIVEGQIPFTLSRDGFMMGYAGHDNIATIRTLSSIMSVRGEEPLAILSGHWEPVQDIAISPDSRSALTASRDATLSLWNISRSSEENILIGHLESVNAAVFSPDGERVASAGADGTVRLWQANDGGLLQVLTGHTAPVNAVIFSADGSQLISGDASGRLIIWGDGDAAVLPADQPVLFSELEAVEGMLGITRRPINAGRHPLLRDTCRLEPNESILAVARALDGSVLVYSTRGNCEGGVWITAYPGDILWHFDAGDITDLPLIEVTALTPLLRINNYETVCSAASQQGSLSSSLRPYTAYPPDYLPVGVRSTLNSGIDVLICHEPVEVPVEHCHRRGRGPNPDGIFSYIFTRARMDDRVSLVRYDTGEIIAQRTFRGGDPPGCPVCISRGITHGSAPTAEDWLPWVISILYENPNPTLRTIVNTSGLNGRDLPDANAERLAILERGTSVNMIARNEAGDWVLVLLPDFSKAWVATRFLDVAITANIQALPISTQSASSAGIPLAR